MQKAFAGEKTFLDTSLNLKRHDKIYDPLENPDEK